MNSNTVFPNFRLRRLENYIFNFAWEVAKTVAFVCACFLDGIILEDGTVSKCMCNKCNDELIHF